MKVADVDMGHFIENKEGKKEATVTGENHDFHQREEEDGIRQCDMEEKYNEVDNMDLGTQWGGNNEATDMNEKDEEYEDIDHESSTVSDKALLQLFIETQKLTIDEDGDWLNMMWHMAQKENGCHHNPSGDIRISDNVEDEWRLPLFMEQEADHLGWMEDDLEEEWERKYRSPNSYHDSSPSSTEDHRRLQEDLMAEWLQIEAELEASDIVQPARSSMGIHESIDMKAEVAMAEWQLVEGSEEAEWRLDDMISHLSTDVIFGDHQRDDSIREIRCIVTNAKDEIRRIAATAQEKLHKLKAGLYRSLDEKTCLTEYADSEPSRDHGDSSPQVNGEDNTDSPMDGLTLHLELSFDIDDQEFRSRSTSWHSGTTI